MSLKRKHLKYGLVICITCLIAYIVFSILGENILISIGNQIEKVTGPSSIMPSVPLEIIKTLTSGIFISTIVAMVFYNQEYMKLHEESIKQLIESSRKLANLYGQIPYLPDFNEDDKLKMEFYKERSRNNAFQEIHDEFDSNNFKILSEIKKEKGKNAENRAERESSAPGQEIKNIIVHEQEKKYRDYLIQNEVDPATIDSVLEMQFSSLNEKVEKCRDIYMQILDYDMDELKSLCDGLDPILRFKKPAEIDEEIVWDELAKNNSMTANMIAKRLFFMYERGKLLIMASFGMDKLDIDTYGNADLLAPILLIQKQFIIMGRMPLPMENASTVIIERYSKFNYTIAFLHELLNYCAYRRKRDLSKLQFVKTSPKRFTLTPEDEAIIQNIYEEKTFPKERNLKIV